MDRATLSRRNRYQFATALVYSIAHRTDYSWTVKGRIETMAKNVADLLVDVLVEAGVRQVYGVSGDSLNGITEAIRTRERVSGFM